LLLVDLKLRKNSSSVLKFAMLGLFHWAASRVNFYFGPLAGSQLNLIQHITLLQSPTMQTVDSFQFYSGSADVAPGKGAGETLVSPADTFNDLRKIPHWRRSLAKGENLDTILPFTRSAQLWMIQGKSKTRREDLEATRASASAAAAEAIQRAPNTQSEMPPATSPKKKKTSKRKGGGDENNARAPAAAAAAVVAPEQPEGEVVQGLLPEPPPADVPVPEPGPDQENSVIRFCPTCRDYLYLQVEGEEQNLFRVCRVCGYKEEDVKGGLVMETVVREHGTEGYKILLNEYTRQDPRLPRLKTIPCPEPACDSNHGKAPSDIIYIKHDAVNMLYMYICDVCGFTWRSAR
jgi:DNA-directed RNA polymerase subunit M/transcription elongation factor TFIIS